MNAMKKCSYKSKSFFKYSFCDFNNLIRVISEVIMKIQENLEILFILGQDISLFDMILAFACYSLSKKTSSDEK